MNFAGALGGPVEFNDAEMIISFSKKIAEHYATTNGCTEPEVLFLPPIDPREFSKTEEKEPYQVVYAGKYRSFIGKPPKVGGLPSVEIFRDGPRMQSREQVREILKHATILYSFENSSIVTEAVLSGTPARFVPNEFLGEVIAEDELGLGGIVQSESPRDLEKAISTIDDGIAQYYEKADNFLIQLAHFVEKTQRQASLTGCRDPITVPTHGHLINQHRVALARQILQNQGLLTLIRVTFHFVSRRLSLRYWLRREST